MVKANALNKKLACSSFIYIARQWRWLAMHVNLVFRAERNVCLISQRQSIPTGCVHARKIIADRHHCCFKAKGEACMNRLYLEPMILLPLLETASAKCL